MEIHVFGNSNLTGHEFVNLCSLKIQEAKVVEFKRDHFSSNYFDLSKPETYIPNTEKDFICVSFAPLWILTDFFNCLFEDYPERLKNFKGLVCCSSSSVITKRFSFNKYDQELFDKLFFSEQKLSSIFSINKKSLSILRPTLIYGVSDHYKDKNLSTLISIMDKLPFILLPKRTGLRQPIHYKQLASVSLASVQKMLNQDQNIYNNEFLSIGGDETLTYKQMIINLQNSLSLNNDARKCYIISIPNNIFYFLSSFLILISPRFYESLIRISCNLSGFKNSHEITNTKPQPFPLI
tara:strand:- start:9724 stop:10605 length:882 start_codon:yes stop_codon:yes gene_type:complete